jgi:collagenase-like PrtC family protease
MRPSRAVLIYKKSQIQEVVKESFTSIYFGSETCDFLIPTHSDIDALVDVHRKFNVECVFVTPYVTEHNFYQVERMLKYLEAVLPDSEIVVNDWGVINFIQEYYPRFRLILGRILNRQRRSTFLAHQDMTDMRLIESLEGLTKYDQEYLRSSILQNGYGMGLLNV